ncbi:MAG: hypothetical protein IBX48_07775 [Thiomicrospira sp.]|uniref:hypothetical protein n=1 Tax=Thiomicrospira sp. TaxID=935 RepID=UPI0019EBC176|nr:hypothetical protein [Thiomicrospira sp.]MBE0494227.1 hypothetical protein [Thiomicrospira sp.]
MSEPITPKAEHHVVEGEFVEAESKSSDQSNQSEQAPKHTKKAERVKASGSAGSRAGTANLLTWIILFVSGTAFALGLASWLHLQQVPSAAQINQQLQPLHAELAQVSDKLQTQQQQIAEFKKTQQAWETALNELEQNQQTTQAQLQEMQLRLSEASQAMFGFSESDDKVIKIDDPKLRADLEQAKQDLQTGLQTLREELQQLNQRAQQEWSAIEGYVESEQWQQDKQRLQTEIQTLTEELNELAQTQADWMARMAPKVQQAVDEITPQLEGIFSRFNELFSIKKHPADQPGDEGAQ